MTVGDVAIYRRNWTPEQVLRRVDSLAAAGLELGHQRSGRITALSGEWETMGCQVEMTRESLLAAMAGLGDKQFAFQYWVADDEDADVTCTLQRIGDEVVMEDFGLDGLGGETWKAGQDKVIRLLLKEFLATGPDAVGLVVDRWGTSFETPISESVTGAAIPFLAVPELLVLRPEIAQQHPELGRPTPFHGFAAYDRDDILDLVR